jgi:hypothetical protein
MEHTMKIKSIAPVTLCAVIFLFGLVFASARAQARVSRPQKLVAAAFIFLVPFSFPFAP